MYLEMVKYFWHTGRHVYPIGQNAYMPTSGIGLKQQKISLSYDELHAVFYHESAPILQNKGLYNEYYRPSCFPGFNI